MNSIHNLYQKVVDLLQQLIAIPSFSKEEEGTARLLQQWFHNEDVSAQRSKNNVFAYNLYYDKNKPTLLLNSHHDTVRPTKGYTKNPFDPLIENEKLFGLGSNDAGASLVALMAAFLHFYKQENLPYNLIWAATAEEEISGPNGITSLLPELGKIDCAIVGEPTLMQMAIAERGLMVLDILVKGASGHAARNEGVNAIYKAIESIAWFHNYEFEKVSELLGKISMNVTIIETENKAHNVVPDGCRFTVDVRLNELYTHEEILAIIRQHIEAIVTPRSMRLRSSIIALDHPLVQAGLKLGMNYYGSPTLSDKALMPFPTLKLGPGDSARSHTADEFIYLDEIQNGIKKHIGLINNLQGL